MTSAKFSGFLTPPLVCILDKFIVLNPRNLPFYIHLLLGYPLPLPLQTSYVHAPLPSMREGMNKTPRIAERAIFIFTLREVSAFLRSNDLVRRIRPSLPSEFSSDHRT